MNTNTWENTTDRHLVERVLSGEANAFGIIIKNTEGLVARIVFEMINNDSDRKDISQDIYIKAYQKLPGFKFQSKLATWIGRISYNTCIDHIRKKKLLLPETTFQEETGNANDMLDMMNAAQGNFDEPSDNIMMGKNISGIIKKQIEKLQPIYKTLITLYHNEELSYEEIGEITSLPEGTIKSYLFRARRELKENILRHYKKEDLC